MFTGKHFLFKKRGAKKDEKKRQKIPDAPDRICFYA